MLVKNTNHSSGNPDEEGQEQTLCKEVDGEVSKTTIKKRNVFLTKKADEPEQVFCRRCLEILAERASQIVPVRVKGVQSPRK